MSRAARQLLVTTQTLAGIEIFSALDERDRESVLAHCHGRMYQADEIIVDSSATSMSTDVFFIVSGRVRITQYSNTGQEVIFREQESGSMFGELAAVDGHRRSAFVHALCETFVVKMESVKFVDVLQRHPSVAHGVMKHLCGLVRSLSERVFEHDALTVNSRIHSELLRMAHEHQVTDNAAEIRPAPTDETFAKQIGTQREAVNKELKKMERMGLIKKGRGYIKVLDIKTLAKLVNPEADISPKLAPGKRRAATV